MPRGDRRGEILHHDGSFLDRIVRDDGDPVLAVMTVVGEGQFTGLNAVLFRLDR